MPSINPSLTGNGVANIDGGTSRGITEVSPKMTVAGGLVDFDGPAGFERVHHAGWVGLGFDSGGLAAPYLITWSTFLRYPWEDFRLPANIFATVYFWDLTPGTTVELEVDW